MAQNSNPPPFATTGSKIRQLREARSLFRARAAEALHIDITSLSGWESGHRLPRLEMRAKIAELLKVDVSVIFNDPTTPASPPAATLINTHADLPGLLLRLANAATARLRALRLAAPYPTPAHVQTSWRHVISERLLNHTIAVQRIEIIYHQDRLQELISNVLRYDGCDYHVKSFCAGIKEVVPAMGGYFFDDEHYILGAYWTGVPPGDQPGIYLTGEPFRTFYNGYWDEIWRRGTVLNLRGAHDLSELEAVARKLGITARQWPRFVEQARAFEIGDGAPPFV